ncbi:MAG: SPOR domain-containing protein [Clostridia bacterium]
MRYSRIRKKRTTSRYTTLFLLIVLIGTIFYFSTANMMGNWVAKNIVSPLLNRISNGDKSFEGKEGADDQDIVDEANEKEATKITENLDIKGISIYGIQMGAFKDKNNAEALAKEIQDKGGAGFIIQDGTYYRVLASGYKDESDALKVKGQLSEDKIDSRIFPIEVQGISLEITASEEKVRGIKEAFLKWRDSVDKVGNISLQSNNSKMDIDDALSDAAGIRDEFMEMVNTLKKHDSGNGDNEIYQGLIHLYEEGIKDLDEISRQNYTDLVEFLSEIRYTYIKMIDAYAKYIDAIT